MPLLLLLALVTSSAVAIGSSSPLRASNPGPIVDYKFDGNLTDSAGGSTLEVVETCTDPLRRFGTDVPVNYWPCVSSSGFGSDETGTFWEWASVRDDFDIGRGGGFRVTTSATVPETFTLGLRFKFTDWKAGYKKVIDYENGESDNGLYIWNDTAEFYPFGDGGEFSEDQVIDFFVIRKVDPAKTYSSGKNSDFLLYSVTEEGTVKIIDIETDDSSRPAPVDPSGDNPGSILGFFFDDFDTIDEAVMSGRVYALKMWPYALSISDLDEALGAPLDPSVSPTTTTTTTTTVPEPQVFIPPSTVPAESTPTTTTTTTTVPGGAAPVPVLVNDELPQKIPGEVVAYEDGVPVNVEIFVEASTDLVLRGDGFELRLAGECSAGCEIRTLDDGRQVLELEEGGLAKVSGEGFSPGSPVYVWLFSEPRFLGELTVNADGSFTGSVPLGDIAPGEHTLQVNGISVDGLSRTANLGVVVNTVVTPTLPTAGLENLAMPWVLLLLATGGMLVLTSRRTRRI